MYATTADVQDRLNRIMSQSEIDVCETLLEDAAIIVDSYNVNASAEAKKLVSCHMVIRQLGDGSDVGIPIGATQGSMSGLGYSQSWTMGNGSTGEMYLTKLDKKLLGVGNRIGSYSPVEDMCNENCNNSISC